MTHSRALQLRLLLLPAPAPAPACPLTPQPGTAAGRRAAFYDNVEKLEELIKTASQEEKEALDPCGNTVSAAACDG